MPLYVDACRLVHVNGAKKHKWVTISTESKMLGLAGEYSRFDLAHGVSREHARIMTPDNFSSIWVEDQKSRKGTYLCIGGSGKPAETFPVFPDVCLRLSKSNFYFFKPPQIQKKAAVVESSSEEEDDDDDDDDESAAGLAGIVEIESDSDEEQEEDDDESEEDVHYVSPPAKRARSSGGVTVAQLKDQCRARGLKVGGTKAELVARLANPSYTDRSDYRAPSGPRALKPDAKSKYYVNGVRVSKSQYDQASGASVSVSSGYVNYGGAGYGGGYGGTGYDAQAQIRAAQQQARAQQQQVRAQIRAQQQQVRAQQQQQRAALQQARAMQRQANAMARRARRGLPW